MTKNKLLIILFTLLFLFTSCSTKTNVVPKYEAFNEHGVLFDVDEIDKELKNKYYYQQLNDEEKLYYQALYYASNNYSNTIEWTFFPDSQILQRARRAFVEDNPLYYWINYQSFIFTEKIVLQKENGEEFIYYESTPEKSDRTDIKANIKKLEKIAAEVIETCYDDNPYEYVRNIHDYLCKHIDYVNNTGNQQTLYGALLEGKCVCEGYSRAFQYLTNKAGFESVSINGFAKFPIDENTPNIAHAWNKIKINDHWYFVDVTWDDQDSINNEIMYTYFLLNDDFGNIDHRQSTTFSFDFPVSDDPVLFHIDEPICGFRSYDEKQIDDFIFACINKETSYFIMRFLNDDDYYRAVEYLKSKSLNILISDISHNIMILN